MKTTTHTVDLRSSHHELRAMFDLFTKPDLVKIEQQTLF
jgi:hypothetical protein